MGASAARVLRIILIGAVLGSIAGMIYGFATIGSAALYYWFLYLVVIGFAPGVIWGALFGGVWAIIQTFKGDRHRNTPLKILMQLLLIVGIVCAAILLVYLPSTATDQKASITYQMRWLISNGPYQKCQEPIVLIYQQYPNSYEVLCSADLERELKSSESNVITATFAATYDFGKLRGYHIERVGGYEVTPSDDWIGGGNGCGGEWVPACGTPEDTGLSPWR